MYSKTVTTPSTDTSWQQIEALKAALAAAEAVIIGAGAGLSTSAGFTYDGRRFHQYFDDFSKKFGIPDMYSGGFYPFASKAEYWGWWSRHIWLNRYAAAPKRVYNKLLDLVEDQDYFVITTNVDHQFQLAGFDKKRLFYTQGDYGLLQCSVPCHCKTYDNADRIRAMLKAQGFIIDARGNLTLPEGVAAKMTVPEDLIPRCPVCGEAMTVNLRADDTFVEDEGWHAAQRRYGAFLEEHRQGRVLILNWVSAATLRALSNFPFGAGPWPIPMPAISA